MLAKWQHSLLTCVTVEHFKKVSEIVQDFIFVPSIVGQDVNPTKGITGRRQGANCEGW